MKCESPPAGSGFLHPEHRRYIRLLQAPKLVRAALHLSAALPVPQLLRLLPLLNSCPSQSLEESLSPVSLYTRSEGLRQIMTHRPLHQSFSAIHKCGLACWAKESALRWQLLLHLAANLIGDLCKRSLLLTGLVVEDNPQPPYGFTGRIQQDQFIFKMLARRVELQIALASPDAAKVVLVTDFADASKIRCDDKVLVTRRLRMDGDQDYFRVLGESLLDEFLSKGRRLCIGVIHLLGIYFAHTGNRLLPRLLGER